MLHPGDVVELVGDLGAGKTQLVRGVARGIGSEDEVQSPTYNIERIYTGGSSAVYHYDLHRLTNPGIVSGHLIDSMNNEAIVLIEWADTAKDLLPADRKVVKIDVTDETERTISANFDISS